MLTLQRKLITALYLLLVSTILSGDMKLLSDNILATMTAQNGVFELSTQRQYERIQLENTFLAQNLLKERLQYFNNLNNAQSTDNNALEHQIEMSLISISTQIASTVTLSALFPIFGLPVGIGISTVPGAFEVEVTDVSIEMDVTIEIRE